MPKARLGVSLELSADGVMIVNVDGAAAQQAGIVPGDRIVTIDGEAVRRPEDVIGAINRKRPGDTIELTMERGEETKTLQVTLGERTRLVPP